ncbi:MAG: M14 family metallocarboxypeptidase [Limisphaerales bacterium]
MESTGISQGGYHGETIDIRAVLRDIEFAARQNGWSSEVFHEHAGFNRIALHRRALLDTRPSKRIYISTGIHGDEPAGPLAALRLLRDNHWPANAELWFCPCLNPASFVLNRRENLDFKDLNRDYRNPETEEVRAHIAWLEKQPRFDLYLCLHEDWETHGFYLYEQNPDSKPSLAEGIIETVKKVCAIDTSEIIEDRPAKNGIIRPNLDPLTRPQWAEAFYLIMNKSRQGYTLEAPSAFLLDTRVAALTAGVNTALEIFTTV